MENKQDNKDDSYLDETDEKAVCEYVDGKLREAKAYRKRFEADWAEYERFYNGEHWKNVDKRPKINWTFSVIEYEVPLLQDSRPGTDVISIEDEFSDDAKVLKESIDYVYSYNHLDIRLAQAIRSSLIATNGYLYVDYDPDKENGEGQIIIRNLNWRSVFLDPSEGDLDDMSYVVIRRPVKVDVLKRQFPFKAEDIHPEEIEDEDVVQHDMYMIETKYHASSARRNISIGYKPEDMAYLVEAWCKDYTMVPIPQEESLQIAQDSIEKLKQGMIPAVERFQDHNLIIQVLSEELQNTGIQIQQEQMENDEALATGPQIIEEEIQAKIAEGAIVAPEEAQMASDQLMQQLVEQAQPDPQMQMYAQLLQDLIEQHKIMLEQNPNSEKPKYPYFMRLIVKVCDEILYDGPTPVKNGKFPIAPVYAYKIEGEPYATGELKNIIDPQKAFNELYWDEHQNLRLNANSGWVMDDNSGIDETTLSNEPGIIVKKKAGTDVRRLEPGTVSPQLSAKQQANRSYMEEVSGITEVAQGKRPQGISAAAAISALQEQSIGRMRLKSRMIEEYTMQRLGELVSDFILKYWTKEKMLKVYDDDGRIQSLQFDPSRMQEFKYEIRMVPGSTFGISKEAIFNHTQQLLSAGAIDAQLFFDINRNNIPFAAKALERLQQRDELAMQSQQLAEENAQLKAQLEQLMGAGAGNQEEVPPNQQIPAQ